MTTPANNTTWLEAIKVYWHPRVLALLGLGFSAGIPFLLVFSTLSAWLREYGVSRTLIGFFSWVGITYSIKFLWAPVIERTRLGWMSQRLGHRRSWMLIAQVGIAIGLLGMSQINPSADDMETLTTLALLALFVAFCSATQDITVDAFRIEIAGEKAQGALAASYIFGYRLALLVAGAGALYISVLTSWETAYVAMACCMLVGILTVLWVKEPRIDETAQQHMAQLLEKRLAKLEHNLENRPWARWLMFSQRQRNVIAWFSVSVLGPIAEFFMRNRWHGAIILGFVGLYRLSDITMGVMANPFYIDMGYTIDEIAKISKSFGFFMTMLGSALGGIFVAKYGLLRPLLMGGILAACTNLLFALISQFEVGNPSLIGLAMVISADNISGGLANVAFIAYLSSLTNRSYTASQYALFSSLMTLPGKILAGYSGVIVDAVGYFSFFVYAAGLGIPAILLVLYLIAHRIRTKKYNAQMDLKNGSA